MNKRKHFYKSINGNIIDIK